MTVVDSRSHGNAFDLVRLCAAAMVLYSHHFALSGRPEPGALGSSVGHLGLGIFFSLSGYLVSLSLASDPHAGRFLLRRLLRIMPGLTVNVVFCTLVVGLALTRLRAADYLNHPTTADYFYNLLFSPRFALPGVLEHAPFPHAVNGSLWTLPFEVLAYFVLAVLGLLLGARVRWVCPALMLLCIAVSASWHAAAPVIWWDNDLRHLPNFLGWFFAGATLAHVGAAWLDARRLLVLLAAYALIEHVAVRQALALLVVPALTLYVGRMQIPARYKLPQDWSYGVYLYAFPIQQVVITQLGGLGFWPSMALAALLTVVCASLSWRWVEAPLLRLKPRTPRQTPPATAAASRTSRPEAPR